MAKFISFTVFDTSDNSTESFSLTEPNEQIDALSNEELKSALAFGLAARVTGIMDVVCELAEKAKMECLGEDEPDKQPDNQSDNEYKIVG